MKMRSKLPTKLKNIQKLSQITASDASDASLFKSVYPVSASEQSVNNPIDLDNSLSTKPENLGGIIDATASTNLSDVKIDSVTNSSINNNNVNINNINNNKQLSKFSPDIIDTRIKSNSNNAYTLSKSDASDASDASTSTSHKVLENGRYAKTKAEQAGKPDLPCIYCDFKDPIEFDLSLHYLEKHRQDLIRLPIGKSSIDDRADYAVELSKKKLFESFKDEDEVNDDEEFEADEDGR